MFDSSAIARYKRDVLVASAAYGASLIAGTAWFRDNPASHGAAAYIVALIPALSIVAIFVAIGRYLLRETDEYLRMLMVRQSLIASGIALSVATLWGFLESFALAPHVDAYWFAVIWFAGLGAGACVNRLIERR